MVPSMWTRDWPPSVLNLRGLWLVCMIYWFTVEVVHWSSAIVPSRVDDLLKLLERYRIGQLFWPILSTIGLSDFHTVVLTLIAKQFFCSYPRLVGFGFEQEFRGCMSLCHPSTCIKALNGSRKMISDELFMYMKLCLLYCVSLKKSPVVFWHFFQMVGNFSISFLHTYYTLLFMLDYSFFIQLSPTVTI